MPASARRHRADHVHVPLRAALARRDVLVLLLTGSTAVVLAGLAIVLSSPWPLLPVCALAAVAVRFTAGTRRGIALGLGAALVGAAGVATGGAGAGAGLLVAVAVGALTGVWWARDVDGVVERLRVAERQADSVGVRDDATGCANRHGLVLLGEQVLQEVRRRGDSAHALLVEIAGLDDVRRRAGTGAVDEVVASVADALRVSTRATDVVARWTADTFAVVGPGSGSVPAELERRVRVHLLDDPPVAPAHWPCRLTAGTGVLEPWDGGTLEDLLARAEEDLSLRRALRAPSAPEPPVPRRPV